MKRKINYIYLFLLLCGLTMTAGCSKKEDPEAADRKPSGTVQAETKAPDKPEESIPAGRLDEEAAVFLEKAVQAIELQYAGQTFSEIPAEEMPVSPLIFGGSYVLAGRVRADGLRYVIGVSRQAENPLAGMSCANASQPEGFTVSQFDGGSIILLEESGTDLGLSFLYDALQRGAAGIDYMQDAAGRGVTLIPPEHSPFLKVSMIKSGLPVTEFIPLSEAEARSLKEGTPVPEKDGNGSITYCTVREDISVFRTGEQVPLTEEMKALAAAKSGYAAYSVRDLQPVTKAVLKAEFFGEKREEVIENSADLDLLLSLLTAGTPEEVLLDKAYEGTLTLTMADKSTVEVWLPVEAGGFLLGNASAYELSLEDTKNIWACFTKLDSFRRYGSRVYIKMEKEAYTADDKELAFTLTNDTDHDIHFSLSPVLYRKSGDGWVQVDSIMGVCGTLTPLPRGKIELTVPWKDAYELKGPGTYRLEIQAMPEEGLRFEVSDTFELTE